jgi:hypothetical protein
LKEQTLLDEIQRTTNWQFNRRLGHYIFMNTHADFIGRCIDNALYIGFGIAILLIVPRQMKRKFEAGAMTEEKSKKMIKIALVMGGVMIALGIFRIIVG